MAGLEPAERQTGYQQLQTRAVLFVRQEGGAVSEDALIRHVFGNGGNPALWRPLLRQILDQDSGLLLRADGYWALRDSRPESSELPRDFIVLDVETTGLRPYRQRMIEICAIRYEGGVRRDLFSTLLNPERRLPAYISRLTGIDDGQLAGAPVFPVVAEQLVRFLGDHLLVGYNIGFDLAFINAELKRAGQRPLLNEWLDLLPLANQLVSGIRRSGLGTLCQLLGVDARERHRATADAEATAVVFGRLLALAAERGLSSLESLQRAAAVDLPVKHAGPSERGRSVLDRSHLDGIPKCPGVYLMRDVHDQVIYVGKAKNLRNRVASYYSQPLGYTRKMEGLLEAIARIDVVEAGSELEALLLESQFIRRYNPRFNTQQRNYESYPYIKVDIGNPWPRILLTRDRADDGARYFGPFRSSSSARAAVDLLQEIYPLRTCTRSFRTRRSFGSPCIQLDLGRCLGPCAGVADRDTYRKAVFDAIAFLHGDHDDVLAHLQRQLEAAAERLDFERAARLRDQLRRAQQIVLHQQLLDEALEIGNVLIVTPSPEPGARELLMVVRGRLWASIRAGSEDSDTGVAGRLERSWRRAQRAPGEMIAQDMLDQIYILARWLRKHAGHPAILPLRPPPTDWQAVVETARALNSSQLSFDPVRE
jgi:DNA polymerase III epsilon subunit family exonuclease